MGIFKRKLDTSPSAEFRRTMLAAAIDGVRNVEPAKGPSLDGARKHAARRRVAAQRMMFASADVGRLTGDWPTTPVPADWVIYKHQRTLVARSREQANNNDYMKAYLRLIRMNVVGSTGIVFQSQAKTPDGKPDTEARQAIDAFIERWGRPTSCDVTGKLSWRQIQSACIETTARDGEFFLRFVYGSDAGPYGVSLQVIDPQRCPVEMDRVGLKDGAFVRHGIEFNRYGKPTAYYFSDPSAEKNGKSYTYHGRGYVRVPADEIIHGFVQELPGQKRGLPWLSTGLFRAKQTSAMEEAAIVNARMGASKMGFIQFDQGTGPEVDDDDDLYIDAEAGTFPVLPEGAKFQEFAPQYPQGEFVPFVKQMLRATASGGGVSYHSLSGDLTDVNFSSIRHGTLDEREAYKERQEWLREELCDRVIDVLIPRALLAGHIVNDRGRPLPAAKLGAYLVRKWQPRRWKWIDPRADVQAASDWKDNLLASPSQLIREQGKDPAEVWVEIAEDIKVMQAAGIPMEVIAASFGRQPKSQKKEET